MNIPGEDTGADERRGAFAAGVDTSAIITRIASVREARALPLGSVAGDRHGGLTFTDAVAAVLESRSMGGWQELRISGSEVWTVIVLNR